MIAILCALLENILIFMTMLLELPISVLYVAAFIGGCGGSFSVVLMTAFAYLADVTKQEKLPMRMGKLYHVIYFRSSIYNIFN